MYIHVIAWVMLLFEILLLLFDVLYFFQTYWAKEICWYKENRSSPSPDSWVQFMNLLNRRILITTAKLDNLILGYLHDAIYQNYIHGMAQSETSDYVYCVNIKIK